MRAILTEPFVESLINAPPEVQRLFGKQLALLLKNWRHPSLQAARYDATKLYARVSQDWRFYYRREGDTYYLLDITPHPK